ncbi:glycosyltransferase family 2 protein [Candidatus Woesearchaeota archaeon]|nr:glycosyltransferase family 2 protein [Candidatus Woesearchaeota archaeon]
MAGKKVYIVMPAYRAASTISSVFERIPRRVIRTAKIIVVEDGSTDNTLEVINKLRKKYRNIKLIVHPRNKGYGAAQKTGFSAAVKAEADVAVLLHSDGQYPPELLQEMIRPIASGEADIVTGSRILGKKALGGGMPLYKYLGNRFLTALENLSFGLNISEYHTGYIAYSRKALTTIPFHRLNDTYHFDGQMILVGSKKKLRIKEIPIPTRYAEEKSHLNPVTYGFEVLGVIVKNWLGRYDF